MHVGLARLRHIGELRQGYSLRRGAKPSGISEVPSIHTLYIARDGTVHLMYTLRRSYACIPTCKFRISWDTALHVIKDVANCGPYLCVQMATVGFTALPSVGHTCYWHILLSIVTTAAWTSCCPQSLLLLEVFTVHYSCLGTHC